MAAQTIRFSCPLCGKTYKAPPSSAGKHGRCTRPGCPAEFVVPSLPAAEVLPEAEGFDARVTAALAAIPSDGFLFVRPNVPSVPAGRARQLAVVPADEIVLGLVGVGSSTTSERCLVVGTRGVYFKGDAPAEAVSFQALLAAAANGWDKNNLLARVARAVGGTNAAAEAVALRVLRDVRQVCAANPADVPRERPKEDRILAFARKHFPDRPIRHAGIACSTSVEESTSVAGGILGVVTAGVLDADLGFGTTRTMSHFLQLVMVTQKNLYVHELGTLRGDEVIVEEVFALVPDEDEDKSAALSRLVVARSVADETGGRLLLRGEIEEAFTFPAGFGPSNARMPQAVADAVAARRGE